MTPSGRLPSQIPRWGKRPNELVVELHRGHVGQQYRVQGTDVDPDFHGGRDAEQVDLVRQRALSRIEEDALEARLACLRFDALGLSGQLLAMEAERGPSLAGQEGVVVISKVILRERTEFAVAIRADHCR